MRKDRNSTSKIFVPSTGNRRIKSSGMGSPPSSAIDLGNEGLILHRGPDVLGLIEGWQLQRRWREIFIRNEAQQMPDYIEPGSFLVLGIDHIPGRLLDVGASEHLVLRPGIFDPAPPRLQIHGAQLPSLGDVVPALL